MANSADSTRTPRTLTEREQRALLKVTGEHRAGYRDHMLYAMALGTGLREHEFIALSVGDVFRDGRPRRRLLLSVFTGEIPRPRVNIRGRADVEGAKKASDIE